MADDKVALDSHESLVINLRRILWGGASIAGAIILAAWSAYFLSLRWSAPYPAQTLDGAGANLAREAPRPQSAPQQERVRYEAEKRRLLESWQWTDRANGFARIPVEEAMRIMAARDAAARRER